MSDYLVNLARRSVGIAPVARPRSGPGPGPVAGLDRGVEHPSAASTAVRGGPSAGTDPSTGRGSRRPIGVEPSHDESDRTHGVAPSGPTAEGPARVIRETGQTGRSEPRTLPFADRAPAAQSVADPPAARIAPELQPPTEAGRVSPVRPISAIADLDPEARRDLGPPRDRPAVEPRRGDVTVELPLPAVSAGAGRTDVPRVAPIEPGLAPAPLGVPRTVVEAGPGREVHVRIGTLEIHAASDTPAPLSPPAAAPPAGAGVSPGGFDDFVRLRSYAPWER